jgi:hypothetical protein
MDELYPMKMSKLSLIKDTMFRYNVYDGSNFIFVIYKVKINKRLTGGN